MFSKVRIFTVFLLLTATPLWADCKGEKADMDASSVANYFKKEKKQSVQTEVKEEKANEKTKADLDCDEEDQGKEVAEKK